MTGVSVCIVYPADPLGVIPGGIDTFIRGIIRTAPSDIHIKLIGITTEPGKRPVGRWTECTLGSKTFEFYPLLKLLDPNIRTRVPLSLLFTWKLLRNNPQHDCDVLEFHRIEPSIVYYWSHLLKNAVVHQNMEVLRDKNSDIKWKYLPGIYYSLEGILMRKLDTVYCVRENAVDAYRNRFPDRKKDFRFIPTWVDPEVFYPADHDERRRSRQDLAVKYQIEPGSRILVTVGRLDRQKDPLLLLEAFEHVTRDQHDVQLFYIGDGVLRDQLQNAVDEKGLGHRVHLTGLLSQDDVSRVIRCCDLFVLPSAYEGMPMCVLEALGCGIPVVSTDVGEVARVVLPGVNGEISGDREPESLASSIEKALSNLDQYTGNPCLSAIRDYVPSTVLSGFYQNYRELARKHVG